MKRGGGWKEKVFSVCDQFDPAGGVGPQTARCSWSQHRFRLQTPRAHMLTVVTRDPAKGPFLCGGKQPCSPPPITSRGVHIGFLNCQFSLS